MAARLAWQDLLRNDSALMLLFLTGSTAFIALAGYGYWVDYWPTPIMAHAQLWTFAGSTSALVIVFLRGIGKHRKSSTGRPPRPVLLMMAAVVFGWMFSNAVTGLAAGATTLASAHPFVQCALVRKHTYGPETMLLRPNSLRLVGYGDWGGSTFTVRYRSSRVYVGRFDVGDKVEIHGNMTAFGGIITAIERNKSCNGGGQ